MQKENQGTFWEEVTDNHTVDCNRIALLTYVF